MIKSMFFFEGVNYNAYNALKNLIRTLSDGSVKREAPHASQC